nr:hypothetical protein [Campylobacteraceae bacterium]
FETSKLLGINRNTVNKYFNKFREEIYNIQTAKFKDIIGSVELDESYFGATRIRGNRTKLKRGRGTLKQPVFLVILPRSVGRYIFTRWRSFYRDSP